MAEAVARLRAEAGANVDIAGRFCARPSPGSLCFVPVDMLTVNAGSLLSTLVVLQAWPLMSPTGVGGRGMAGRLQWR